MNFRNPRLTQALIGLALLGTAGTALALNNYPGLQCVPLSGQTRPNSSGHSENDGSTTATMVCPVFVDSGQAGLATSGNPQAFVTDLNTADDVCCSSRVKNTSQSVVSGGTVCSSGASSGAQQLVLTNPGTPGGNFTFTQRWIQCDVPGVSAGASEIRFYRY
jgi:hypothetical protein